ncbi:MAG: MerR family transcriptional regulator [Blautia sp.]|nr:MerR family transcriptional regulator [Blautia sp.]MCM1283224.1 MerR family transcriptional regulator [Roseburia sp.]MCM1432084.1 MerR family transcriptional regulator [Muribaculaceae bacterium]MCM1492116.1 MerR family transcriptional regulator [Muribaculaceae bacterium]
MGMTLREICDTVKVSRRAVQGYEKAGLVSASGKNRYGYLIYDVHSQERIRKIKLFQELGFSLKEIKDIIDAPNPVLRAALEKRVEELQARREQLDFLIEMAYELIDTL